MNADDITWRLAQLASLSFQERYVIGGNVDEYVLDAELIENVDGLKHLVRTPKSRNALTKDQMAALEDLFLCIENRSGEALSAESREEGVALIREGEVWKDLRAKAAYALFLFGMAIDHMTAEEIANLAE